MTVVELPEGAAAIDGTPEAVLDAEGEEHEVVTDFAHFAFDEPIELEVGGDGAGNELRTQSQHFIAVREDSEMTPQQRFAKAQRWETEKKQELGLDAEDEIPEDEVKEIEDSVVGALVYTSNGDGNLGAPVAKVSELYYSDEVVDEHDVDNEGKEFPDLQDVLDEFESEHLERRQKQGLGGVEYE